MHIFLSGQSLSLSANIIFAHNNQERREEFGNLPTANNKCEEWGARWTLLLQSWMGVNVHSKKKTEKGEKEEEKEKEADNWRKEEKRTAF